MQMTFRQLVANSLGPYLIRKWVKRQKSSSRFIIDLIMDFCSSCNSNSVFAVYFESKAIFIHPFSDFSVTTRIVRLGITSGEVYGYSVKALTPSQTEVKRSGVGGGTVTLANKARRVECVLQTECPPPHFNENVAK